MNKNIIKFLNLSYLNDKEIFINNKNNKIKSKHVIIKTVNKIKESEIKNYNIKMSNLANLNEKEEIININNDFHNKLKEIDHIINNIKYIEYYTN